MRSLHPEYQERDTALAQARQREVAAEASDTRLRIKVDQLKTVIGVQQLSIHRLELRLTWNYSAERED